MEWLKQVVRDEGAGGASGGAAGGASGGAGGAQGAAQGGESDKDKPKPIPYERFQEVVNQKNDLEKRLKGIEDAKAATQTKALEEQKKFQDLWENEKKAHEATKGTIKGLELRQLRSDVAVAKGLPADLAARLQGETKEAIEQDADQLLAFVKTSDQRRQGPPPAGRRGSAEVPGLRELSAKEVREKKADILSGEVK